MSGKRGKLFVIAAPSGAGKTSLVRALMQRLPALRFSISYTTRKQRPNERDEHDYFFVDKDEVRAHGRRRANSSSTRASSTTTTALRADRSSSCSTRARTCCWRSTGRARSRSAATMPECRTIFVLPPSRAALEQRLRGRGTDSDEVIARRLRDSLADLSHWSEFDYIVVNDDFDRATDDLEAIVTGKGEHLRRDRRRAAANCSRQLLTC